MIKKFSFLFKNNTDKDLYLFKKYWRKPLLASVVIAIFDVLPIFIILPHAYNRIVIILSIIVATWLAVQMVKTTRDLLINNGFRYRSDLDAQRINTQIGILVKIIIMALVAIGIASILVTFPQVREVGISIFASAGIAGIALGIAAQKILGNIIAGMHIAFTQSIKIGDTVVVEKEEGIIEEINLTRVVLCTVDKRRIVIPIDYFIGNIFQNWTMSSADLLGVIRMELDYTAPIQKIREALDSILQETDLWDKKRKTLQVSGTKPHAIELRILVSAANASDAWNLKCFVTEKLITFLQTNYSNCLPKLRLEINEQIKKL